MFTLIAQNPPSRTGLGNFDILNPESVFYIQPGTGNPALATSFNLAMSGFIAALTIGGSLFFLFQIFIAALAWINGGANETTISESRQKILYSIVGIVVIVAAYAIVALVARLTNITFLNPFQALWP